MFWGYLCGSVVYGGCNRSAIEKNKGQTTGSKAVMSRGLTGSVCGLQLGSQFPQFGEEVLVKTFS